MSTSCANDQGFTDIIVSHEAELYNTEDFLSKQDYEHKTNCMPVVNKVKGRLKKCLQAWEEIQAPQFIIDIIQNGYKIPFLSIPPPFKASNNKSAINERQFVEQAITELLLHECIIEVGSPPGIINPLSVSIQRGGKKCLIIDLRHVNLHIFKSKFRCQDISMAKEVLKLGDFMFSFDFKSGYHHVDIFKDHQKFLAFSWTYSDGSTKYFQFTVLPFGLSSAPYIFTKLLKPIVKKWRSQGNSIVIFLDDGLGAGRTYTLAKIFSLQAHADLLKFGFLPNESKCEWDPIQEITWLGVVINTLNCTLHLTAKRVNSILTDIDNIIAQQNQKLHVKRFASICGKIISCGSCVGNI